MGPTWWEKLKIRLKDFFTGSVRGIPTVKVDDSSEGASSSDDNSRSENRMALNTPGINLIDLPLNPLTGLSDISRGNISMPVPGASISFDKAIEFEGNSGIPKRPFNETLQELLIIMHFEPTILIEITAHAGAEKSKGRKEFDDSPESLNKKYYDNSGKIITPGGIMSQRAKAVYNFLIDNGIDPNRVSYRTGGIYNTPEGRKVTFKILNP